MIYPERKISTFRSGTCIIWPTFTIPDTSLRIVSTLITIKHKICGKFSFQNFSLWRQNYIQKINSLLDTFRLSVAIKFEFLSDLVTIPFKSNQNPLKLETSIIPVIVIRDGYFFLYSSLLSLDFSRSCKLRGAIEKMDEIAQDECTDLCATRLFKYAMGTSNLIGAWRKDIARSMIHCPAMQLNIVFSLRGPVLLDFFSIQPRLPRGNEKTSVFFTFLHLAQFHAQPFVNILRILPFFRPLGKIRRNPIFPYHFFTPGFYLFLARLQFLGNRCRETF